VTHRVDAHVHAFPDRLALAVRSHLDRGGVLTAEPLLAGVAEQVRTERFDAAWILPYAHRAGVAESVNEWSAAHVVHYPWLVGGATFHPDDPDIDRLVERALVDLRLRVVKLHCSVGRFSPADGRLEPLWRSAAALGVPVVTHAGQHHPGETPAEDLDALEPVLRRHPDLKLVLAHTGQPNTDRALQLMQRYDNLYADLTPVWLRPVDLSAADLERFAGRILFGSDAPNNPLGALEQAQRVMALGLQAQTLEAVMGGTAWSLAAPVG